MIQTVSPPNDFWTVLMFRTALSKSFQTCCFLFLKKITCVCVWFGSGCATKCRHGAHELCFITLLKE